MLTGCLNSDQIRQHHKIRDGLRRNSEKTTDAIIRLEIVFSYLDEKTIDDILRLRMVLLPACSSRRWSRWVSWHPGDRSSFRPSFRAASQGCAGASRMLCRSWTRCSWPCSPLRGRTSCRWWGQFFRFQRFQRASLDAWVWSTCPRSNGRGSSRLYGPGQPMDNWLIVWFVDWRIEWMKEWLIEWTIDSLNGWMNDWLKKWLNESMNEWLINWRNDWLIEGLIEWMNDWLSDLLTH